MKKILAAILLMVYFTVSTGFVVCVHYCMNRFTSAQLGHGNNDKCTKCGMHKKANGCCRDEVKVVKLQLTHTTPQDIKAGFSSLEPLPVQWNDHLQCLYHYASFRLHPVHGPPLTAHDLCIENRVFRI